MDYESCLGWTVEDWLKFHYKSSPDVSFERLVGLVNSQKVGAEADAAWISLVGEEHLERQWRVLQSRKNKRELVLYGVPVAVKDNIDVKGVLTTAGCPSFGYVAERDAGSVERLRDAGAIIIGKTNLDQFATGLVGVRSPYGKPCSVFSERHVSGGSSSGSASVVARGIVPLALGTDTAGSGRVPAGLNNLIGVKPTRGVVSCAGVVPACKSLDCVTVMALNLSDAERCLKVLVHCDPDSDEYSRPFIDNPLREFTGGGGTGGKVRIAIPREIPWFGDEENPVVYAKAIQDLRAIGAQVEAIDFSPFLELARCLYEGPWVAERYYALKEFYDSDPPRETLDLVVKGIVETAKGYDATDVFKFEYRRQNLLQQIRKVFREFDVLCVPTCPLNPTFADLEAEPILVNSRQGTWTNFVNLADLAALAVPAGFRSDGLPHGITFIGEKFTDYALLSLAEKYFGKAFPNGTRSYGKFVDRQVNTCDTVIGPKPQLKHSLKLAVVGAHMKGLPLHWQLEQVNATYLGCAKTSKLYKLYALPRTGPILKPGLRRVGEAENGSQIQLELYSIPIERFGEFMAMVPPPLGIGSVELESGEYVNSFICEEFGYKSKGAVDITVYGGFKPYVEQLNNELNDQKKPFKAVLVANRGEIAVRIIKTLKKLKITSVAIYSTPDKYSQHVLDADLAVSLEGHTAAETYLDMDKVIKAAKDTGAEAIIPGYGFLSENPTFVDRCVEAGIIFIGPSSNVIRKLGLKHSARELAEIAGVPLVPGSGLVTSVDEAKKIAYELHYPIMIKSTAGGGGIGLQKVDSEEDIAQVFETVQHQGKSYFGDSGVFLERFVDDARHVEIQVMGDGYGKAIALGERDCSLQRRNQKIIEETPAPNLPDAVRAKMRKAAESLCSFLNYKCAGTVEFIYDAKRQEFYFLEVNTRLQVEHPITEMVTGLDLVEWMLRIAADQAADFDDVNITVNGASIEARIYAENPVKDFRPSPGLLTEVQFPKWARVDTWISKGTRISAEYDPTLAKVIVHAKDRNEAILKMAKALDEVVIQGCITNIDYLRSIITSEMFKTAKVATKVLDSYAYKPRAIEITSPGAYTTVQDYPGRVGYWRIGVPPSGPMDSYSFRLANRIVGNHYKTPAIEITLNGPKILFHEGTVIAITGGTASSTLNGEDIDYNTPIEVKRGDELAIGKLTLGCRAYLAIRGGLDIPEFLGSRSTFALGNMGGFNGRVLKLGDVIFMNQLEYSMSTVHAPVSEPSPPPASLIPNICTKEWTIGVVCGPHGSPDFFHSKSIEKFFSEKWKVHYNSNRFGVRLIGPKPSWARKDGGEAGLHPSNAHDYVYAVGAINFTGDEPVIITVDGPSLGGFVCQAVVPEAELWKVGQLKPGDSIQFYAVSYESARKLKIAQDLALDSFQDGSLVTFNDDLALSRFEDPIMAELPKESDLSPKVTYRQAGDRYILIEYGENEMDLNISYRVNRLSSIVEKHKTIGIVEMSPGVRSVLVEFDGYKISQQELLRTLIAYESEIHFDKNWTIKSKIFKLPMAFEDSKTMESVKRYQETIRSNAPWLPNNVDFVAEVNGIRREEVRNMLYTARFMVLGLGDVFLGAPCAVPLDPRQRFLGTKYNPSRTYTPNAAVGIGGMYMCIYCIDSPGGYQLMGRTIPIWDKLQLGNVWGEHPWLLSPFDQVEFYPVSEAEIDILTEQAENGRFQVEVEESVFDNKEYLEWIDENIESIMQFQQSQGGEKADRFAELIQVANTELEKSSSSKMTVTIEYPDDAEMVYSEYSGRFWKSVVSVGDTVNKGDPLIVIEAMKTEMVVAASTEGKVYSILHKNGDMVDSGDLVVVLQ
ncbi:bifunctional urea carboxylase/allophanate hydrolase Ecym_1184 [Eremothecium cymbalariae DBVPG|uniref:Urea amidolyase n=1 Tax=Eremothecium cymbalariae (strain CBS 270.75 / DBVPG 7215 / KCTC 17166 / NRRL Y-17582) TaxID=931890 RepID=G8JMX0_ERECY|nr:hypothetical protein Ecym_1184 [Eremothecium cymbalariae DBVPG\